MTLCDNYTNRSVLFHLEKTGEMRCLKDTKSSCNYVLSLNLQHKARKKTTFIIKVVSYTQSNEILRWKFLLE